MPHILVVDDEPRILRVLATLLKSRKYEVTTAESGEEARELVLANEYDLMMSDIKMREMDGIELLRIAHEKHPTMPVVLLTAFRSPKTALEALKLGAFDYVTKPLQVDDFLATVENALKYKTSATTDDMTSLAEVELEYGFGDIVAVSPAMKGVCAMIKRVAPICGGGALIWGETGTGKTLIVRSIHEYSPRKEEPFLTLNCAELPEPMLDVELFGMTAGGMAIPSGKKLGILIEAGNGTVLLDEVGSMPMGTQEKLIQVFKTGEIETAQGKVVDITAHVIGINNERMEALLESGAFKQELFDCFSAYKIELAPLRKRREDILPLIVHTMRQKLPDGSELPAVTAEVREILTRYSWPGNTQELTGAIKYMLDHAQDNKISRESLPGEIAAAVSPSEVEAAKHAEGQDDRAKALKAFLRDHIKQIGPSETSS